MIQVGFEFVKNETERGEEEKEKRVWVKRKESNDERKKYEMKQKMIFI